MAMDSAARRAFVVVTAAMLGLGATAVTAASGCAPARMGPVGNGGYGGASPQSGGEGPQQGGAAPAGPSAARPRYGSPTGMRM